MIPLSTTPPRVFQAELKDRTITVAVKKLSPSHKGKINELIKQEIFNLISLEHENLIRMWHYHGGKRHQLLVYEYMEKKSLSDVLKTGIIYFINPLYIYGNN